MKPTKTVNVSSITIDHRLRKVLPPIAQSTRKLLSESLRNEGISEPIHVAKLGNQTIVLDGAERLKICRKLGIKRISVVIHKMKSKNDAAMWRLKKNLSRRHMSPWQRCLAVIPIYEQLQIQGRINKKAGGRGEVILKDEKIDSAYEAAILANVSRAAFVNTKAVYYGLHASIDGDESKLSSDVAQHMLDRLESEVLSSYGAYKEYKRETSKSNYKDESRSVEYINNGEILDSIFCGDVEDGLARLPDERVSAFIYSPPYPNVFEDYGGVYDPMISYEDYESWTKRCLMIMNEKLRSGGVVAINVDSITNPDRYEDSQSYRIDISNDLRTWVNELNRDHGCNLKFHVNLIWWKKDYAKGKTSWGSAGAPRFRRAHEDILIFQKDQFKIDVVEGMPFDLTQKELQEWSSGIWELPNGGRGKDNPHPYPFNPEVPRRVIKMFTAKGDLVVDPFSGSGSTLLSAKLLGRKYHGIDANAVYCDYAKKRLEGKVGTLRERNSVKQFHQKMKAKRSRSVKSDIKKPSLNAPMA